MGICDGCRYVCDCVRLENGEALAQDAPSSDPSASPRERALRDQLKNILKELDELQQKKESEKPEAERPTIIKEQAESASPEAAPEAASEAKPDFDLADMSIVSKRLQKRPEGHLLSATVPSETDSQPTRTMKESMESLPGIVLRQANGPRDFSIMIRGQGAKTSFAVRDIKIYEDGIQQTQSDGLSRLDMQDPWFMRSVEVTRGASSSLYDNYALGGMVQFRTRRGSDIHGLETFFSGGSFGYQKYGVAIGQETEKFDIAMFASHVAEDGFIQHSNYNTQTINFNVRYKMDDEQNFYFKAITNWLNTKVPTRLTQGQFFADERQAGGAQTLCTPGTYNGGCAECAFAGSKPGRSAHDHRRHVRAADRCEYRPDGRSRLRRQRHPAIILADLRKYESQLQELCRFAARRPTGKHAVEELCRFLCQYDGAEGQHLPESGGWLRNERDIASEQPWNYFQHRRPVP